MNRRAAAWTGLLVGTTMVATPLAPLPRGEPPAVGAVPGVEVSPAIGPVPAGVPSWFALPGPPRADPVPPAVDPGPPLRVRVAALAVDAPVTPVDVDPDGALAVPADPGVVGWWRAGARPGAGAGTVVLAGHVDTRADGPGALFRLAALRPDDRVVVETAAGEVDYVVQGVRHYPKAALPAEAFDTGGSARLVLITCGGVFDRSTRRYADNVVAYAVPDDPARLR